MRVYITAQRTYIKGIQSPPILNFGGCQCGQSHKSTLTPSASRCLSYGGIFDWDTAEARLAELNARAEDPSLWSDSRAAQKVMRERQMLERQISSYKRLEQELEDAITLIELGEAEDDEATIAEGEAALKALREVAQKREIEALLSGEADANDAYLEDHAGAGGTESQDWAEMLVRMYSRWAEDHGYKVTMVEASPG